MNVSMYGVCKHSMLIASQVPNPPGLCGLPTVYTVYNTSSCSFTHTLTGKVVGELDRGELDDGKRANI